MIGGRTTRRYSTAALLWCLIMWGIAPIVVNSQSGGITPNNIEIDLYANHYPGDANIKNFAPGASYIDWVLDSAPNTSITVGLDGAAQRGHFNGLRIVDGTGSALNPEKDIFLSGGKVNTPDTWNIGPGTTGSSKFDATQMYIANNQDNLFFGMERAGNNGTTAFDFEFNKLAPDPLDPRNSPIPYIPNRSQDDILISYELHGSGGDSGSVNTYIFRFSGTLHMYQPECDDDPTTSTTPNCTGNLFSSINGPGDTETVAPPWGYVDAHGNWTTASTMARRLFAEAQVPRSYLGSTGSPCGATYYVQIRTRASSALGSDAKDTTKIFPYTFEKPTARADLSNVCGTSIHYDASASTNASNGTTGLTYSFVFEKLGSGGVWSAVPGGSFNDSDGIGDFDPGVGGTYRIRVTVTENAVCMDSKIIGPITVYPNVGGDGSLSTSCAGDLNFTSQGTGGSESYAYSWRFFKDGVEVPSLATTNRTGSYTGLPDGTYTSEVTIKDANKPVCLFVKNPPGIVVRQPLQITAIKDPANTGFGSPFGDDNFNATVKLDQSNAGSDPLTLQWQRSSGAGWTDLSGQSGTSLVRSMSNIFTDGTVGTGTAIFTTVAGSDPYNYRVGSLTVRLHASRLVNALTCTGDSNGVTVKALKAIDP
jgi:hypothetical protein